MSRRRPEILMGFAPNSWPEDLRRPETAFSGARHLEPVNGHILIPYQYRGAPPSHPGLCDGCGMLDRACRCIKDAGRTACATPPEDHRGG